MGGYLEYIGKMRNIIGGPLIFCDFVAHSFYNKQINHLQL